jgi:hypothetical protein
MVDRINPKTNINQVAQKTSVTPSKKLLKVRDIANEIAETLPAAAASTKAALGKPFQRKTTIISQRGTEQKLFKTLVQGKKID